MRISDWSSDVCSSDLHEVPCRLRRCGSVGSPPEEPASFPRLPDYGCAPLRRGASSFVVQHPAQNMTNTPIHAPGAMLHCETTAVIGRYPGPDNSATRRTRDDLATVRDPHSRRTPMTTPSLAHQMHEAFRADVKAPEPDTRPT